MGNDKSVAIGKKYCLPPAAMFDGKVDILPYFSLLFDTEPFITVCPAKGAAIVRTADRNLEDNGTCFTWRPDNCSFVLHLV